MATFVYLPATGVWFSMAHVISAWPAPQPNGQPGGVRVILEGDKEAYLVTGTDAELLTKALRRHTQKLD